MEGWPGGPTGGAPTSDGRVEKDLLEQITTNPAFKMEGGGCLSEFVLIPGSREETDP